MFSSALTCSTMNYMKKVVVDGEEVIFEGDVPSETSRIYQLLMEALSEQARVIYSIEVDGEPATGDTFPETYNETMYKHVAR